MFLIAIVFQWLVMPTSHANSCREELLDVLVSAKLEVKSSPSLTPECVAVALKGGKQGCKESGKLDELKALLSDYLTAAQNICEQQQCSKDKKICLGFVSMSLKNQIKLANSGINTLIKNVENAKWTETTADSGAKSNEASF